MAEGPILSVIIVIVGDTIRSECDTDGLDKTLSALMGQVEAPPLEIIVPYHPRVRGIEALKTSYPAVNFFAVDLLKHYKPYGRDHHDELRSHGAAQASGDLLAFLEDHVVPDQTWANRIIASHQQEYAGIGGAIENDIDRPANWAVYFSDLGKYQNPLPAGESSYASTVNISYKKQDLEAIRQVWQETFNESVVNSILQANGSKLALSGEILVYQHRAHLNFSEALREFFIWGKSYGKIRSKGWTSGKKTTAALFAILLPFLLCTRMTLRVLQRKRFLVKFLIAFPLTVLCTTSWSLGEMAGYLQKLDSV
jgi:hypothetical protein